MAKNLMGTFSAQVVICGQASKVHAVRQVKYLDTDVEQQKMKREIGSTDKCASIHF